MRYTFVTICTIISSCIVYIITGNVEMPYPQFFLQPHQQSVKREVFTSIKCGGFGGIGNLSYAFYTGQSPHSNMMQLVKRTSADISTKIAEYRILKVESKHKGYYQCIVTDEAGVSIFSDVIYLTVVDNYITHVNITTEAVSLHTTTKIHLLSCDMPDSAPPAWPKWFRDELPLDPEDPHMFVSYGSGTIEGTQVTFGDLVLYAVNSSHRGLYQCSALNKLVKDVQINIKLYNVSVIDIGSIGPFTSTEIITSDHSTSIGDEGFIFCAGIGSPSPKTTFLVVKPRLKDTILKDNRLLMIPGTATLEESLYYATCQVGDSYYSATLTVRDDAGSKTASVNFTGTDTSPIVYYVGRDLPPVSLSCKTTSQTAKQWFINGAAWIKQAYHDIDLSGSFDLTANDVRDEDSGVYQCKSFSDHHTVYRTQVLCVVDKLRIMTNSPSIVVHEGMSQKLECTISGSPTPYMEWKYNQNEVLSTSLRVISKDFKSLPSTTILELTNVSLTDAGVYNCKAWNNLPKYNGEYGWSDEAQKDIKLSVVASVKIFSPQTHVLTFGGKSLNLECSSYGRPLPTLPQWYFEDLLLKNDSLHTITFNPEKYGHRSFLNVAKMSLALEGNYSCTASNVVEGIKKTNSVRISVPVISPVEVTGPSSQELEHGVYETITCKALGQPPAASMSWVYSNGNVTKALDPIDTDIVTMMDNNILISKLSLTLFGPEHAGNYTCISSNRYQDNVYTHNFTVQTKYVLSVRVKSNESQIIGIFGQSVTMMCSVVAEPLPSQIYWEIHGEPIRDSESRRITTTQQDNVLSSQLEIVIVNYDSETDYNCTASNYYKGEEHKGRDTISLIVENPVKTTPSSLYAYNRIGKQVSISCDVEGKPLPDDIVWYFSGTPGQQVTNGENYSTQMVSNGNVVTGTLTINRLALLLLGDYTCSAANQVKGVTMSSDGVINVATIQSVIVSVEYHRVTVSKRDVAKLQCIGKGVPPPDSVKWSYKGVELPYYSLKYLVTLNNTRIYNINSTLRIANVNISDEGEYTCSFSNSDRTGSVYQDDAKITLTVDVPVEVSLSATEVQLYDGEDVRITCTAYGKPDPTSVNWIIPSTDTIIKTDNSFNVTVATKENGFTSILTVKKMSLHLEKTYECRCKNHVLGKNVTTPAFVTLLRVQNVVINSEHGSISGLVGQSSKMSCMATGVMKPSEIRWYKDKHELSVSNERYIISQTPFYNNTRGMYTKMESQLTVKIVKWGDRGRYSCKATNENRNVTHHDEDYILMNIGESVTIRDTTKQIQTLIGEETGLISVAVGGYPLPSASWFKNGTPLTLKYTQNNIKVEEYLHMIQLKFDTVSTAHEGNYSIIASNTVFNKTYSAQLRISVKVGFKPKINFISNTGYNVETNTIDISQGEINRISCWVRSKPFPTVISWFYNNSDVSYSHLFHKKYSLEDMFIDTTVDPPLMRKVLVIKRAGPADSGDYLCRAVNYINEHQFEDNKPLIVRVVSQVVLTTANITYEAKLGLELNITCIAQGYPLPKDIVWFHNGSVVRSVTNRVTILQGKMSFNKKLSTLWLRSVGHQDLGGYECRSSNIVLGRQRSDIQKFELLEARESAVKKPITQNELIIAVVLAIIILIAIVIVALIIVWKKRRRKPSKGYNSVIEPGNQHDAAHTLAADKHHMDLIQIGASNSRNSARGFSYLPLGSYESEDYVQMGPRLVDKKTLPNDNMIDYQDTYLVPDSHPSPRQESQTGQIDYSTPEYNNDTYMNGDDTYIRPTHSSEDTYMNVPASPRPPSEPTYMNSPPARPPRERDDIYLNASELPQDDSKMDNIVPSSEDIYMNSPAVSVKHNGDDDVYQNLMSPQLQEKQAERDRRNSKVPLRPQSSAPRPRFSTIPRGNSKYIYDILPDGTRRNKPKSQSNDKDDYDVPPGDTVYDVTQGDDELYSVTQDDDELYDVAPGPADQIYDSLYDQKPPPRKKKVKKSKSEPPLKRLDKKISELTAKSPFSRRKGP